MTPDPKLIDAIVMLIAHGGAQRDVADTIVTMIRGHIQAGLIAEMQERLREMEDADEARRRYERERKAAQRANGRVEVTGKLRFEVFTRDGFRCQYCGISAQDGARLAVDHIIPVARGGATEFSNLTTACEQCNGGKGATPLPSVRDVPDSPGHQRMATPGAAASNTASEKISVSADLQKEVDTLFLRGDSDTPPPVSKSAADSGVPAAPSPETKPLRRARSAGQACPPGEGVLTFPCAGEPKEWSLSKSQLAEWSALYQGLDVLLECKKALAWIRANHVKTAAGMPRFLVNWLSRTQNRGGASRPAPKPYREMPYLKRPEPQ